MIINWGCPADLLTNQTVLDPKVHYIYYGSYFTCSNDNAYIPFGVFYQYFSYDSAFQVHNYLGITDQPEEKHAAIAGTVDKLGDGFRPALRYGWLAYIKKAMAYPARAGAHNAAIGQGESIVDDTGLAGAGPA